MEKSYPIYDFGIEMYFHMNLKIYIELINESIHYEGSRYFKNIERFGSCVSDPLQRKKLDYWLRLMNFFWLINHDP